MKMKDYAIRRYREYNKDGTWYWSIHYIRVEMFRAKCDVKSCAVCAYERELMQRHNPDNLSQYDYYLKVIRKNIM